MDQQAILEALDQSLSVLYREFYDLEVNVNKGDWKKACEFRTRLLGLFNMLIGRATTKATWLLKS